MKLHPADAFAPAEEPDDYKSVVAQVKKLKLRALAPTDFDDVVTLLEYMRTQELQTAERNAKLAEDLTRREVLVSKREHDVAIKMRIVEAALKVAPKKWWSR